MDRRRFMMLTGATAAATSGATSLALGETAADLRDRDLLARFLDLPGRKGVQIDVGGPGNAWRVEHSADAPLFCGSCFKTFVLATYLQEVEAERLSESEQLAIDDSIRSVGGGVFEFLTGKTLARNVLEAMIAHSDNTATDVAMQRVGVGRVREFLANAGLRQAQIGRAHV